MGISGASGCQTAIPEGAGRGQVAVAWGFAGAGWLSGHADACRRRCWFPAQLPMSGWAAAPVKDRAVPGRWRRRRQASLRGWPLTRMMEGCGDRGCGAGGGVFGLWLPQGRGRFSGSGSAAGCSHPFACPRRGRGAWGRCGSGPGGANQGDARAAAGTGSRQLHGLPPASPAGCHPAGAGSAAQRMCPSRRP